MTTDEREKLIESMRTKAEIRLCLGIPNMLWEQAEELQKAADELTRQAAKIAEARSLVSDLSKCLSCNITLSQCDYMSPPEPATKWDYEAAGLVHAADLFLASGTGRIYGHDLATALAQAQGGK